MHITNNNKKNFKLKNYSRRRNYKPWFIFQMDFEITSVIAEKYF